MNNKSVKILVLGATLVSLISILLFAYQLSTRKTMSFNQEKDLFNSYFPQILLGAGRITNLTILSESSSDAHTSDGLYKTILEEQQNRYNYDATAEFPTNTSKGCNNSEFAGYANIMEQLPELRELFNFSLTPSKIFIDETHRDKDVRWSMIVMVKSHSKNVFERSIARSTWAQLKYHKGVRMEVIFIVGKAGDPKGEIGLQRENKIYGDLLQLDREEKYEDVIFKTIAGMQYAASHFPCDWIYSSADDDIMPNLVKAHSNIEDFIINKDDIKASPNGACQGSSPITIVCGYGCEQKAQVRRIPKDKWFVSKSLYSAEYFPPYCMGPWYSMRNKHAWELYSISRFYTLFWIDDVWITGNLRMKHVWKDTNYDCQSMNLTTALPITGIWDGFVIVGSASEIIYRWQEYYETNLMANLSLPSRSV